MTKMNKTGKRT